MDKSALPPLNRRRISEPARPTRIVQFGEGNFLRAFVDWMIHRMNQQADFNTGVAVIQPIANGLIDVLNQQDGLYTLYLNGVKDGKVISKHELISCIQKGVNPYRHYDEYLEEAENPALRLIISNTTEAGIAFDEKNARTDQPPGSFPGKLTAFLHHRFQHFEGSEEAGLILIPCELIDRNGDKLKETINQYADLWQLGPAFKEWINSHNTFCNTLVDRIVPGYPKDRIKEIWQELSYHDQLVSEGEYFHLWVIEGPEAVRKAFPADQAGLNVVFTDDMTPYRTRKVRILNGAHTSMVPVGYLYGLETVREAVEHEVMGDFVKGVIFDEIIPTLDLPQEELVQFANDVLDRFKNPFIKHYLISIALNSVSKFKTRVLPSLLEYINRKGQLPPRMVFSLAALIRFYKGYYDGKEIPLQDDDWVLSYLKDLWEKWDGSDAGVGQLVEAVLRWKKVWKQDLSQVPGLKELTTNYLMQIDKAGMKVAIEGL